MEALGVHRDERERRKGEVDAWVRWRLEGGLKLFAGETKPACGSMFELLTLDLRTATTSGQIRGGIEDASKRRRAMVEMQRLSPVTPLDGRWALFIPDAALYCQLAHDPGFVDEAAAPAWDLWVDVIEVDAWDGPLLLNWVPEPLLERIDQARTLCSAGELSWADSGEMARSGIAGCLVSMGIMRWADE
jgi:hypothetical protein